MTDKRCPKHPDQDTMVLCFGCGRYFCRVCRPPKGAGRYCDACYRESLAEPDENESEAERQKFYSCYKESLAELDEKESEAAGRKFYRLREFVRTGYVPRKVKARRRAEEDVSAAATAPGDAAGGVPAQAAPLTQAATPAIPAREKAYLRPGREKREGPGRVRPAWSRAIQAARETFPITLVEREKLEGAPRVFSSWLAVLSITIGGALLWTLAVVIWRSRNPVLYILIAIMVSLGVAYATGSRFGVQVGVVGACLALLSLVMGELIVLVLFRLKVIRTLDITPVSEYWLQVNKSGTFYPDYFQKLLLFKLLPSAVAAFLVGWWPLKKRLGWKGFRRLEKEPETAEEAGLNS